MYHRLRYKIDSKYSRIAARHIKNGDLKLYETDDIYIYKHISESEYKKVISKDSKNPKWTMSELGLDCEYDYNYQGKL